jgi:hypothetical protein
VVDGESVTLMSRDGADITRTFREISAVLRLAVDNRRLVLDGESWRSTMPACRHSAAFSGGGRRTGDRPTNCCDRSQSGSSFSMFSSSTAGTSHTNLMNTVGLN